MYNTIITRSQNSECYNKLLFNNLTRLSLHVSPTVTGSLRTRACRVTLRGQGRHSASLATAVMERRAVRPLAAFLRTTRCYEPRRRFTTPAVALAGPLDGWQLKLGLEVHAQIASATKLFSASSSAPDSAINRC